MRKLIYIIFLISVTARADILYFDLNNRPQMRQAAQNAANARGEKLIVFPDPKNPHGYQVGIGDLKSLIAKLNTQHISLSSIVVGSHDGNDEFWSNYGGDGFNQRDLAAALGAYPAVSKNIQSLYLWGCYTESKGTLLGNLLPAFSAQGMHLKVIEGFKLGAPALSRAVAYNSLEKAMREESRLLGIQDKTELLACLDAIKGVAGQSNSFTALVGCGYYDSGQISDVRTPPSKSECRGIMSGTEMEEYNLFIGARKNAVGNHEDILDDGPDGEDSTARTLYNFFMADSACSTVLPGFPSPSMLRFLTFYDNIRQAIVKVHGAELNKLNSLLAKMGITIAGPGGARVRARLSEDELALHDVMPRRKLIDRMRAIQVGLSAAALNGHIKGNDLRDAQFLWTAFYKRITLDVPTDNAQSSSVLPRHWLEAHDTNPDSSYPRSTFFNK